MRSCILVLCLIGVSFLDADAYRAAVVDPSNNDVTAVLKRIQDAGRKNVDIVVVPSDESYDNTDDIVKALSKAAKQAGLYLVAHLKELTVCQKTRESVRTNLVFDRQGAIIAVYRKPSSVRTNCTATTDSTTFSTDFGVTFGLMMEEDLVLKSPGLNRDYVVAGAWPSEIPLLSASQFTWSWAYTADANVISGAGIFAGRPGLKTGAKTGSLLTADLKTNADEESVLTSAVVLPAIHNFPGEDLSQYIFRALDVEATSRGHVETLCHNSFCCQFHVKTHHKGSKQEVNFLFAVLDGIRHYGANHYIGTQNCAVFACDGLYKDTCRSMRNDTNIVFDKLSITANFATEHSAQYPVVSSNEMLPADKFNFVTASDENTKKVTIEITDADNLYAFGIFGRDYENDYEGSADNDNSYGIYDYILTEDLQEMFDYLWIRLRILLFIVSIYVLEMM